MKAALFLTFAVSAMALSRVEVPELPAAWTVNKRAEASTPKNTILLSLKKRDLDTLARRALEVSDPDHSEYGKHLSAAEQTALFAPTAASFAAVRNWLSAAGAGSRVIGSDLIEVHNATVGSLEKLFSTHFVEVTGKVGETQRTVIRAGGPLVIPSEVSEHIAAVFGAYGLPMPPKAKVTKRARAGKVAQGSTVTPASILARYNVSGTLSGARSNQNAVAEFQGQWMEQSDLTDFFQQFVPSDLQCDKPFAYKGDKTSGDGVEALLDIEYIMGVAPCAKTEFWGYANTDFCADLKKYAAALSTSSNAKVHSISYGWQGDLSQIGCTSDEVGDVDSSFMSLAAAGFSIIFASGDSGSNCADGTCYPSWPASSPWVTSCGATTDDGNGGEMASSQFGSGGGFANFALATFSQPSYQTAAVAHYLSTVSSSSLPAASSWNSSGRATPDVSAYGENFQVVVDGSVEGVGGTSASTPTFAGIVTYLNEVRIVKNGKAPLGFLNPWLYKLAASTPAAFYDVTEGTNGIDRSGNQIPGFPAAAGWDPATGLGTPNYRLLVQAVSDLP